MTEPNLSSNGSQSLLFLAHVFFQQRYFLLHLIFGSPQVTDQNTYDFITLDSHILMMNLQTNINTTEDNYKTKINIYMQDVCRKKPFQYYSYELYHLNHFNNFNYSRIYIITYCTVQLCVHNLHTLGKSVQFYRNSQSELSTPPFAILSGSITDFNETNRYSRFTQCNSIFNKKTDFGRTIIKTWPFSCTT